MLSCRQWCGRAWPQYRQTAAHPCERWPIVAIHLYQPTLITQGLQLQYTTCSWSPLSITGGSGGLVQVHLYCQQRAVVPRHALELGRSATVPGLPAGTSLAAVSRELRWQVGEAAFSRMVSVSWFDQEADRGVTLRVLRRRVRTQDYRAGVAAWPTMAWPR